jgi:hypothetical protein
MIKKPFIIDNIREEPDGSKTIFFTATKVLINTELNSTDTSTFTSTINVSSSTEDIGLAVYDYLQTTGFL